jgi:hypothetical protein
MKNIFTARVFFFQSAERMKNILPEQLKGFRRQVIRLLSKGPLARRSGAVPKVEKFTFRGKYSC